MYLVSASRWFSFGTFSSDLQKVPFKPLFLDELWSLIHFYLSIVLFVASEIMVHFSGSRNLYLEYFLLRVFKLPCWILILNDSSPSYCFTWSKLLSHKKSLCIPPYYKARGLSVIYATKHCATDIETILIF